MAATQPILFEELPGKEGDVGVITLNRPDVLNALNQEMFVAMRQQLTAWEAAKHIKAVVLRAAGERAFCAGGDIRSAYERAKEKDPTLAQFFAEEYQMNKQIFHFEKPYIALMDGVTMGGGVGISIHGSHRVGTEKFVFAMPETGIGFYPDVGGSYFLPRLRNQIGLYLGLTGARINHHDSFELGLLDQLVASSALPDILKNIVDTSLTKHPDATVTEILRAYNASNGRAELVNKFAAIQVCFSKQTVEEIIKALEYFPDPWCQQTATILNTKSPTSLRVTLRLLQEGGQLSFDECMAMEYRLTCRFLQQPDFFEGIRAVVIDKDYDPKWQPSHLGEVTAAIAARYFEPLAQELDA